MRNRLKELLASGRTLFGAWTMIPHPVPSEILGHIGYDFLVIDMEHALFTETDVVACLRAVGPSETAPIVRLPGHDPILVKRMLDAGAWSLMFPMVENEKQAQAIVSSTRYPPAGGRGFAFMHRASGYGTIHDYLESADKSVCVVAQVESPAAIEGIREFGRTPGLDAIFVGPGDLSAALGCRGQISGSAVTDQMEKAVAACLEIGIPIGTVTPTVDLARARLEMGFNFVAVSNDLQIIMRGAAGILDGIRNM